jgi:hypothetical protein
MENLSDPQTIIALVTGILLTFSETLPFLNTDSNGLVHLIVNTGKSLLKKKLSPEENEPLLQPYNASVIIDFEPITSVLSKTTCDTLNVIQSQNILKSADKYQLDYIISFLKSNHPKRTLEIKHLSENNRVLLESNGYRVNFDSLRDTNIIEW